MAIRGTRSYIVVDFQEMQVKVSGELLREGHGFVVYTDSIERFEAPHDSILISEETKQAIITEIIEEAKRSNFRIVFD